MMHPLKTRIMILIDEVHCALTYVPYPWWRYTALEYFDLLLTGGDTEKFCKEILQ
jgi:hypothetical protein